MEYAVSSVTLNICFKALSSIIFCLLSLFGRVASILLIMRVKSVIAFTRPFWMAWNFVSRVWLWAASFIQISSWNLVVANDLQFSDFFIVSIFPLFFYKLGFFDLNISQSLISESSPLTVSLTVSAMFIFWAIAFRKIVITTRYSGHIVFVWI